MQPVASAPATKGTGLGHGGHSCLHGSFVCSNILELELSEQSIDALSGARHCQIALLRAVSVQVPAATFESACFSTISPD